MGEHIVEFAGEKVAFLRAGGLNGLQESGCPFALLRPNPLVLPAQGGIDQADEWDRRARHEFRSAS